MWNVYYDFVSASLTYTHVCVCAFNCVYTIELCMCSSAVVLSHFNVSLLRFIALCLALWLTLSLIFSLHIQTTKYASFISNSLWMWILKRKRRRKEQLTHTHTRARIPRVAALISLALSRTLSLSLASYCRHTHTHTDSPNKIQQRHGKWSSLAVTLK